MKKFLFLSMLCIMALSGFSCDKQSDQLTPEPEPIGLGQLPVTHEVGMMTQPEYPLLVGKFCMAISFDDVTVNEWFIDGLLMEDGSIIPFNGIAISERQDIEAAIAKALLSKGYTTYLCRYDYNSLDTQPIASMFWVRLHTDAPVKAIRTATMLHGQLTESYYSLKE